MSDDASFSHGMFHIGGDWHLRCSTYADTTPILSLDAGPASFSITVKGKKATGTAVEFARALAREARKFADEMERLHDAHLADNDDAKAAGSDAA